MALELSTAGITVKWAVEATAGTRPTSTYTALPGVKSIPEFGTSINALQCTPLSNTSSHSYVEGLSDPGGAQGLTVNDYSAFRVAWEGMLDAYETAKGNGLGLWVEYAYPEGSGMESFYYPAEPSKLGYGGAEVDSVLENIANFVPAGDFVFAAASN